MTRFVDKLLAWAAQNGGGRRKRLPPAQPIVVGSLLQQRVARPGRLSATEQRRRFIEDASD